MGVNFKNIKKSLYLKAYCCFLEQMKGIEPSCPPWQGGVLPLNYICMLVAKKAGFEPARQQCRPKALAGPPLEPLEYFFMPRRVSHFALINNNIYLCF